MSSIDMRGRLFGRLTAIEPVEPARNRVAVWLCKCVCGTEKRVRGSELRNGAIKSCGRLSRERATRHGMSSSPEYGAWKSMWDRCRNPNVRNYPNYGGRGITVCQRWRDFANFYADIGQRPSPEHSLERNDTNGNYEPGNCRWATKIEQQNNIRSNVNLTFEGRTLSVSAWARELGINRQMLRGRIDSGWGVAEALLTPSGQGQRRTST